MDILKLTDVYMKETGNNLISEGTSIYHNKHFKDGRDIHKITLLNQDIIDKYGLKIGDKYAIQKTPVTLVLSGDEAVNIPNLPESVKGMNCVILRILSHGPHMIHSPHCAMIVLYAAKYARIYDEKLVIEQIQQLFNGIPHSGHLKYYCAERQFWVCYPYVRHEGGDWPWIQKFITRTMNQVSTYPIPEILKCTKTGDLINVKNNNEDLYQCLIGTHIPCWCFENVSDIYDDSKDVYTIIQQNVVQAMGSQVQSILRQEIEQAEEMGNAEKYTEKFIYERRKAIAKSLGHGILYPMAKVDLRYLFDCFHFMWRFSLFMVTNFVVIMWCVWKFEKEHILLILGQLKNEYLVSQFEYWMDNNMERATKIPEIVARGQTCKTTLNNLPYAIVMAMQVSVKYAFKYDNSANIVLTVLCIMYYVVTVMTQAMSILFMKQYTQINRDGTSVLINLMIQLVNLATFVTHHLCSALVKYFEQLIKPYKVRNIKQYITYKYIHVNSYFHIGGNLHYMVHVQHKHLHFIMLQIMGFQCWECHVLNVCGGY